jgi:membrane-associated phospholipid phosphatase
MPRWLALLAGLSVFVPGAASASSIEQAGTVVAVLLPVTAGTVSVVKDDWTGVAQLVVDTGLTVGTAYGLKQIVHEERPDHSDDQSFPSDTAALAFAPAAYLWDRYGWEYGLPAYAAAAFVGYSRVDAKKHHWYDVVASAGIAWGYSRLITTEFHPSQNLTTGLYASPGGVYARASYTW